MSVPGDGFFLMGGGADAKAFTIYTMREFEGAPVDGLDAFNK